MLIMGWMMAPKYCFQGPESTRNSMKMKMD